MIYNGETEAEPGWLCRVIGGESLGSKRAKLSEVIEPLYDGVIPKALRCFEGSTMATLTIPYLPDNLLGWLRERATEDRRSLDQELVHLLDWVLAQPGDSGPD